MVIDYTRWTVPDTAVLINPSTLLQNLGRKLIMMCFYASQKEKLLMLSKCLVSPCSATCHFIFSDYESLEVHILCLIHSLIKKKNYH